MTKTDLIVTKIGIIATIIAAGCWGWVHEGIRQSINR